MDAHFFYGLIEHYGIYAIFLLAMVEGDVTLLLAGALAHSAFFGKYSFLKVLAAGTMGAVISDNIAYFIGHSFRHGVRGFRFYNAVRPRIERLTHNFGGLSIFLSKYIYGLRAGSCIFYGVSQMPYLRFLPLTICSCLLWVTILSGTGYFFSGIVMSLLGDFRRLGFYLLIIVVTGIVGFYLVERFWLSKKVESADPERIQEFEQAAQEKFHELQDRLPLHRTKEERKTKLKIKN